MKITCLILMISAFFSVQFADAQKAIFDEIKIGIVEEFAPTSAQVITEFGNYNIWADGKKVAALAPRDRVTFIKRGQLVEVSIPGRVLGNFNAVELVSAEEIGVFRLYLLKPTKTERVYDDHLLITANGAKALKFVNRVDLEKYIAGVVEAESGKEKGLEFYMVQAIISRTYALSNRRRYLKHGYNLNDRVDCQVYFGKSRWEPDILKAVAATESLVLVDSDMKLITAAFHSNSGGETVSSAAVWSGALPYLTPRRDDFSLEGEHYAWSEVLAIDDWLGYLADTFGLDTQNSDIRHRALNFRQPARELYFLDESFNIPLKDIRKGRGLNSTYFDVTADADSVRIEGRGFGHGTGLSQEGAMRMAALGFSYTDILHFYYNDVHIIDLRSLDFFLEE